jgi:pyroglutamyl-peptidase
MKYIVAMALVLVGCAGCGSGGSDIAVRPAALPDGRVALDYQAALQADAAVARVAWSVTAGALPPGIALGADGTLSGAPSRSGDYPFTVTADDGAGEAAADFSIHVPRVALLSGFGPFAGYPVNPSIEALKPLDLQLVAGLDVRVVELPVEWDVSWTLLEAKIDQLAPSIAIGTGVADSDAMRYETTAHNLESGVDTANVSRVDVPIVPDGAATLPSELPIPELSAAVSAAGFPILQSDSAGAYLCNFVFYHVALRVNGDDALLGGFIHVPPAPSASFQIDDITSAHRIELETLASLLPGG